MGIPSKLKMPSTFGIEKYLLRKAFDESNLLPKKVLWRVKEAFSDGVSSQKKSWYSLLQSHIESKISTEQFEDRKRMFKINTP